MRVAEQAAGGSAEAEPARGEHALQVPDYYGPASSRSAYGNASSSDSQRARSAISAG
jgi:hypothetical protein